MSNMIGDTWDIVWQQPHAIKNCVSFFHLVFFLPVALDKGGIGVGMIVQEEAERTNAFFCGHVPHQQHSEVIACVAGFGENKNTMRLELNSC